jgi:hypothetical protein
LPFEGIRTSDDIDHVLIAPTRRRVVGPPRPTGAVNLFSLGIKSIFEQGLQVFVANQSPHPPKVGLINSFNINPIPPMPEHLFSISRE